MPAFSCRFGCWAPGLPSCIIFLQLALRTSPHCGGPFPRTGLWDFRPEFLSPGSPVTHLWPARGLPALLSAQIFGHTPISSLRLPVQPQSVDGHVFKLPARFFEALSIEEAERAAVALRITLDGFPLTQTASLSMGHRLIQPGAEYCVYLHHHPHQARSRCFAPSTIKSSRSAIPRRPLSPAAEGTLYTCRRCCPG